jgi:prepilin-type N-terminal cleavage/methylation domain-containing protein
MLVIRARDGRLGFGIVPRTVRNLPLTAGSMRGFSLIEILVALVVFSVVAFGVAQATLTSIRTNRESQQKAVAVNLAHQVLECVRSQVRAGRPISLANAGQDCNPAGAPAGYTLSNLEIEANPTGFEGLTRVRIMISWQSPLPGRIDFQWLVDT